MYFELVDFDVYIHNKISLEGPTMTCLLTVPVPEIVLVASNTLSDAEYEAPLNE